MDELASLARRADLEEVFLTLTSEAAAEAAGR